MDEKALAAYLEKIQSAVADALNVPREDFFHVLVCQSEQVIAEFELELRKEGIAYPTPNEMRATSRAIVWSAWVSWLWTAKSERQNADENAKRLRPIAEKILAWAIETGRVIGRGGRTPKEFLEQ